MSRRWPMPRLKLASLALLVWLSVPGSITYAVETVSFSIAGSEFELEVAATPASRFQGLSDRDHLDEHKGMLFVFPRSVNTAFVMRRCLIPIDVIFMDETGQILALHAMEVEPPGTPEYRLKRYPSGPGMRYAIELAGGSAAQLGLNAGDELQLTDRLRGISAR